MSEIETIACPIDIQIQEQALNLAKLKARWNGCRSILDPVVNALVRLGIEPSMDSMLNVCFSGDAKKLAAVVRILRTSGWSTSSTKPKKGDTSWFARFIHAETQMTIWFNFTSSVCRRVKVGTRMEEVAIYETQCGDITDVKDETLGATGVSPALLPNDTADGNGTSGADDIPF